MPPIFESNTTGARVTFSTVHRTSDWIWKRRPLSPDARAVSTRGSDRCPARRPASLGRRAVWPFPRRLDGRGRGIHRPCYHFEATLTSRGINLPHNLDEMPSHTVRHLCSLQSTLLCTPLPCASDDGEGPKGRTGSRAKNNPMKLREFINSESA